MYFRYIVTCQGDADGDQNVVQVVDVTILIRVCAGKRNDIGAYCSKFGNNNNVGRRSKGKTVELLYSRVCYVRLHTTLSSPYFHEDSMKGITTTYSFVTLKISFTY